MTTPYIGRLALGNVGVFMFFVLSGFVIFEALDIFYKDSIKRFLINRFLRIFPTYWASLAFAMLALYATSSPKFANLDSLTILMNISLVGFYFSSPTIDSPFVISVAWAVIVELCFYLGAASAYWIARTIGNTYYAFIGMAVGGLFGYLFCYLTDSYSRFFGYLQFAPYFMVGAALYIALKMEKYRSLTLWIGLVSMALSVHAYIVYNSRDQSVAVTESTIGLVLAFATFVFCSRVLCSNNRFQSVDHSLGGMTYFLFLVHMSVIDVALHLKYDGLFGLAFVVLMSIATAFLLERLVERPLMRLRDRIRGITL